MASAILLLILPLLQKQMKNKTDSILNFIAGGWKEEMFSKKPKDEVLDHDHKDEACSVCPKVGVDIAEKE